MSSTLKVFSYRRCPFAMRVRLTLNEKEIPFEVEEEDLSAFSETLRKLHPEAKVPVLVHGDLALYESAVITEYVEEAFPGKIGLMPSLAAERAEVRLWTYWCNHLFKPDLDRFKYGTSRFPETECVGIEAKILDHFAKMEARLKNHDWLVGEKYTLADIHVFPFVRQISRIQPTPTYLKNYPAVMKWLEKISARPAFQKTMAR